MVKDPFDYFSLSTVHKQNQYAHECKVLIEPEEIVLGKAYRECLNVRTGRTEQKQVDETFQYVPIGECSWNNQAICRSSVKKKTVLVRKKFFRLIEMDHIIGNKTVWILNCYSIMMILRQQIPSVQRKGNTNFLESI